MNRYLCFSFVAALSLLGTGCGNVEFTHVKPGQSARVVAMTKTAPVAHPIAVVAPRSGAPGISTANHSATQPNIVPNPALPDPSNTADKVAELYTKGSFSMQTGQIGEAIVALEEAVHLDPNFSDAWSKLVILYQRAGKEDKAVEAYKKAKKLGQPNGPTEMSPRGTSALIP
jgi:Flp pilus assembly protein TadD